MPAGLITQRSVVQIHPPLLFFHLILPVKQHSRNDNSKQNYSNHFYPHLHPNSWSIDNAPEPSKNKTISPATISTSNSQPILSIAVNGVFHLKIFKSVATAMLMISAAAANREKKPMSSANPPKNSEKPRTNAQNLPGLKPDATSHWAVALTFFSFG